MTWRTSACRRMLITRVMMLMQNATSRRNTTCLSITGLFSLPMKRTIWRSLFYTWRMLDLRKHTWRMKAKSCGVSSWCPKARVCSSFTIQRKKETNGFWHLLIVQFFLIWLMNTPYPPCLVAVTSPKCIYQRRTTTQQTKITQWNR